MRTYAVLPIKRFARAKQRLGATIADPARRALALAMVRDVVAALADARRLSGTLVVTADADAAALAREAGLEVVAEPTLAGHNAAAGRGVARAVALGAERVLLVPGDCPGLTAADVDGLLERHDGPGVVVVADRHGTGTNALLLAPPEAIGPAFGPGSCPRHRALAAAAGVPCAVDRVAALALDVDDAADLTALRAAGAAGPHTAAALGGLGAAVAVP